MAEDETPERPSTDLTRRTVSGLSWMYLSMVSTSVLQFGMTAVLARLLTPAAFGLIALAQVFLRFVTYFAKAGIAQALIQKPNLSRTQIRAAFTLSLTLALAFGAIVYVAAPVAGRIGQEPDLVPILRWLVVGMLLHGLGSPASALLRRDLRFKAIAVIEITSYIVGYVFVGLVMAATGFGVYALVGATLTQAATLAIGSYAAVRHPVLPTVDRASYSPILRFGARVSVVGFFEFLQTNMDTLAVGRWAGSSQLGLYNRAHMLAYLPSYHLANNLGQVLFPSFSAIQQDRKRLRGAYLSIVSVISALVLPLNAGMAVAGREIVLVMLGSQWVGAIGVLPWLLLASSLAMIGNASGVVAEAQAALNAKMVVALTATATLGGLLLLAEGGPLWGYGAALAGAAAVSHAGYLLIIARTLETSFLDLVRPYLPSLLAAALVASGIALTRNVLLQAGTATALVLLAEVVTGTIVLALAVRFGPLARVRAALAERLEAGQVLSERSDPVARTLTWLIGSQTSRDRR